MKRSLLLVVSLLLLLQYPHIVMGQTPLKDDQTIRPLGVRPVNAELKARIVDRLSEVQSKRAQLKLSMEERRLQAKKQSEERQEELKDKVAAIRDQRKQALVERMGDKMQSLNERWTNHANKVLERLALILGKIEVRTDRLAENSDADVSSVRTAIAAAEKAIADAQAAVNTQAGQVYIFEVEDEETLGTNVSSTIAEIRADIQEMMELVKEARSAVHDALKALVAVHSTVKETTEGTPGPSVSPTPTATPL